jgi:predicted negative regulator of RcsB-dependent stress response
VSRHDLDLQEQEQLASLKAFWDKYGGFITTIVTIGLLAYAGFNGWRYWQVKQARDAAVVFESLEKAASGRDLGGLTTTVGTLIGDYSSTAYASKGALLAARAFFEAGDNRQARAQLQWVADKGFSDAYKATARIRLAGVLLDEKAYDDALKALDFSAPDSHAALVQDRLGDVQLARGDKAAAIKAYDASLAAMGEQDPWRAVVKLKRESLVP